ncbi:CinA family protein [Nereida sp. MMG025]|uniref:CinA family protein n=1 Tax=Nereida sp. MMG025 TaxID=2909981 RepID=UPI001F2B9601|nr:CinA family protein [Nereida sp. MMG025]MCF6443267.1 CinA family protein [Nereida sp. MMG025]
MASDLMASDLAARVLDSARAAGRTIATAESCTGGMVSAALTDIAGSSDVVICGFVTYANSAKQRMLGVTKSSLTKFGAVSEQVAHEMACGAVAASQANLAVSITGIAGPGGSDHKPEGRVCFGLFDEVTGTTEIETVEFGALGRSQVRMAARDHALQMILSHLQ